MSWYVSGKLSEVDSLREKALQQNPDAEDQIDQAIEAAHTIANSSCVGDPPSDNQDYLVTLQGHANPEHKKQPNFSADTVGVSVVQL